MSFKFVSFELCPHEKHVGIVSVKAYDKILLKYKVIQPQDNQETYYLARPKIRNKQEHGEVYLPAFVIDSQIDNEELFALVREKIKEKMEKYEKEKR